MDVQADILELLAAARRGTPSAIGRIFEAARGHLLRMADRELPADVRTKIAPSDVVQETACDLHRDFAQFTGTSAEELFGWLRGILRNNVIDAVRQYREALKRAATREVSLTIVATRRGAEGIVGSSQTPIGSAIDHEEASALNDVVARLPIEYRRVLELRYWSGLSFVDMAPLLGRSPDAARKLWYRALERLQQDMLSAPIACDAVLVHAGREGRG